MTIAEGSTEGVSQALAERRGQAPVAGKTIQDEVRAMLPSLQAAIPAGVLTPERFVRTVLTVIRKNPELMVCNRESFLGSMMTAASLGLEVDPALGQAYLIPYKKECTLQIGYKGYIELAWRGGITIESNDVREHDQFDFERGTHPHLTHKWKLGQERGEVIGYYATATFPDGRVRYYVMDLDDIAKRRARSQVRSDRGPWKTDPVAMSKKTVIRAMIPQIPLSTELSRAIEVDEGIVSLKGSGDVVVTYPDTADDEVGGGAPLEPKSEWRVNAEAELDDLVTDDPAAQAWLMREHGPIPTLDDDRLQLAIEGIHEWAASQAAAEAPVGDPTDPGPSAPPAATQPPVTDVPAPVEDEERDRIIGSTTAMVAAMKADRVRETLNLFRTEEDDGVPNEVGKQRTMLIQILVRERLAGNPAALDLF